MTFPTQTWCQRRWSMSFRLTVDRDDMSDTHHQFWVDQQGRLAELWLAVLQKDQMRGRPRRGALLAGLAVVLVVVAVFAIIASLPSHEREAIGGAASSGVENSIPDAGAARKQPAASKEMASPSYSELPCGKRQWIVFLGSMEGGGSDGRAGYVYEYETERLEWVVENYADRFTYMPSSPFKVMASTIDDVCPDLNAAGYTDTDMNRRFVWLYPLVESKAAAQQVCEEIGKPMAYDCLPVPAG